MACKVCEDVVERSDVPHVLRDCAACGREMHIHEPGDHGRGFRIRVGDRVTIPAGWIKLSLNPLQSSGQLTRAGLEMMAVSLHIDGIYRNEEAYPEAAAALERLSDEVVNSFGPLQGLDINRRDDADQILTVMKDHSSTREFWALWMGHFLAVARDAVAENKAARAAWATACAERCRAMMVFKEALEEVVWMGHSAKRIVNVLGIWDQNRTNSDEQFWQLTFNENAYVLSQIFAVPMVFIQDRAYVGGMTLDRADSRFVDYLFSTESSREAILIEIKTPGTPLLAAEYRGNRPPSRDLAGSVIQVLNYRAELARNLKSLTEGRHSQLSAFTPRCAIIAGNAEAELKDDGDRRSFELFRTSLKDVEVITYDELFRKVEILAELFSLKRAGAKPA